MGKTNEQQTEKELVVKILQAIYWKRCTDREEKIIQSWRKAFSRWRNRNRRRLLLSGVVTPFLNCWILIPEKCFDRREIKKIKKKRYGTTKNTGKYVVLPL